MAESLADFIAGYVGGGAGLLVGSPLDVLKVRLQTATTTNNANTLTEYRLAEMLRTEGWTSWFRGIAPPIIGLAALNSVLFVSYGTLSRKLAEYRANSAVEYSQSTRLWDVYWSGFGAGVACFLVSTPTELVKCRAQILRSTMPVSGSSVARPRVSSWCVAQDVFKQDRLRGFFRGGTITIIRDAPGYGVYFWAYEVAKQYLGLTDTQPDGLLGPNSLRLMLAGGIAGVCSWASVYPFDVIKSNIQTQTGHGLQDETALACAKRLYQRDGMRAFTRGLWPTLFRAFPVNAVTFTVYELVYHWIVRHGL